MRSHILHVRCERRPSKSDLSALSCCAASAAMSLSGACACAFVCVGVHACVGMRTYLVCPAWAWRLVALVCRLLLEAVAARRPRRPVCTCCLFDQPGSWPAGSRGAAARRSRCRSHAVCLGGRGGRGAWCAAVHGGRFSARSSVERKDKLPAWAAPTVVTARSPSLDVGALVAVANARMHYAPTVKTQEQP